MISGLGSAGRGYLAALKAADVPTSLVSTNELFIHQAGTGVVSRRQRPHFPVSIAHINADSVGRFLHFHGSAFARARYKIAIWTWELPSFRDEWQKEIALFDEIWVPSTFCQRAITAMTSKPVVVMPHVVPVRDIAQRASRHRLNIDEDEYVFLYIFDASSSIRRKNPHCLVDAFEAAFSPQQKVRLILKVSNTTDNPTFVAYLRDLVDRNVRCSVLRDMMSAKDVAALMTSCDCYVSPHRSEGFGLTVAEAMAHGKPVVATDFAGTTDFVTADTGFPLDYRLTELEHDFGPYRRGAIWSEPSRDHLTALLREVVCNPEAAKERGKRGRALMRSDYSEMAVGLRMRTRLEAIQAEAS